MARRLESSQSGGFEKLIRDRRNRLGTYGRLYLVLSDIFLDQEVTQDGCNVGYCRVALHEPYFNHTLSSHHYL